MSDEDKSRGSKFDVVVSHHSSKDFELLFPLIPEARFVVYDKSGVYGGDCIRTPNIGREGFTYLTHIIENYDDPSPRTVFMQDDVVNHRPHLLAFVAEILSADPDFHHFPCTWGGYGPIYRRTIVGGVSDLSTLGRPDMIKVACEELGLSLPDEYTTETCAFFSLSSRMVRSRSRDFYERAREWVLRSTYHEYALEHMWAIIFGDHGSEDETL